MLSSWSRGGRQTTCLHNWSWESVFFFFFFWWWSSSHFSILHHTFHSSCLHYNSGLHSLTLWKFVFREGRNISSFFWGKPTVGGLHWRYVPLCLKYMESTACHTLSAPIMLKAAMTWLFLWIKLSTNTREHPVSPSGTLLIWHNLPAFFLDTMPTLQLNHSLLYLQDHHV